MPALGKSDHSDGYWDGTLNVRIRPEAVSWVNVHNMHLTIHDRDYVDQDYQTLPLCPLPGSKGRYEPYVKGRTRLKVCAQTVDRDNWLN
jgi:hypothetical protein